MNRITAIFKSLNIEANEIVPVLLLIAQSIFIGTFYGTFDIGAHTLFLKTYPEDMIPKAYILSGVAGIALTAVYSKMQSRINFSVLAKYTLLFISIITILMRFFFEVTASNWTVFVVFILLGPLNILAVLAFWGTVTRIFNLRQGKRIFGIIDTGQIFGIIISSYAIPLIIGYIGGTKNLLLISAISIVLAMLVEVIIARKFNIDKALVDEQQENKDIEQEQVKLKHFVKNPYILYMALFVVFSMFAAFFVQYSFLVVTNEQYPLEDDLAKYLGFFTGSMMIFTFIVKTFVYSKLMKTYGLKISLILSPALLALFTGIAVIAGYFGGFEASSAGFIYFFLLISLSKLFNKTLKDALEVPSFKLLYQSLSKKIRFDVQAKIDGTINEISALVSGIMLSVLGLIVFVKLIHYSVVLFGLLLIWTLITLKLYKEYRNSLEKSLKQETHAGDQEEIQDVATKETFNKNLAKLRLIHQYLPLQYLNQLKKLLKNHNKQDVKLLPKKHLMEWYLMNLMEQDQENLRVFDFVDANKNYSIKELARLVNSTESSEYLKPIKYLFEMDEKVRTNLLSSLLRTPQPEVQKLTIRVSGALAEPETCGTLVEYLENNALMADAMISLHQMLDSCTKQLIQMFYKTDIRLETQLAIIQLLGYSSKQEAADFLLENISHHRFDILVQSVQSLKLMGYQASESAQPRFFHPITSICQIIAWDISALASLGSQDSKTGLWHIIEEEHRRHVAILMDLLSITYNSKSVHHVSEHLNSGTAEGVGFALELFDLFISEEIKPMILLVFEDIPLTEKARLLQNNFPVQLYEPQQLIIDILNRDPNYISRETKKLALKAYENYFSEVKDDIVAQLFNPVGDLHVVSAQLIKKLQPERLKQCLPRVDVHQKKHIEKALMQTTNKEIEHVEVSAFIEQLRFLTTSSSVSIIDLIDYLDIRLYHVDKKNTFKAAISNYFVFLILDLNKNESDSSQKQRVFFNTTDIAIGDDLRQKEAFYLLGIKNENMGKLVIKDNQIAQNLINHT